MVLHLRNGGTSVVLDLGDDGVPAFVHWGCDLGSGDLESLAAAQKPQRVSGGLDAAARLTLLPAEAFGWQGTPGLAGSRFGRDFSPRFVVTGVESTSATARIMAEAPGLSLLCELAVTGSGVFTQQLTLTNTAASPYRLDSLLCTFALPATATEALDAYGRHLRERAPQRHALPYGRFARESRRGRPGFDSPLLMLAGSPGFGFERGQVFGVHLAWSGNFSLAVERSVSAPTLLQAGELLGSGEVVIVPGGSYTTPLAVASWGDGLNDLVARLHDFVRERPSHPTSPRPVTFNTWEAVYFQHDLARLTALAEVAAEVGAERFVLDDGWFRGRRDDTAGLGDWTVDPAVWPDGLHPLFARVEELGMQCGLWVEPEMVNLDSDLARAHPDWILNPGGRLPLAGRQQHVLDLANPAVWLYLLDHLDALLTEYSIGYLKWDHNRDLLEAGSTVAHTPGVRGTVLALYRLLAELKARHPGLEIESCASGGARVDLGILAHTDRIWASDCIDPLERLTIQKYTAFLVPYELMGAHVGGPQSHSTGRSHSLSFRAGVALFGHLGIEWDLTAASNDERAELADWVGYYKHWRHLLHSGHAVFTDQPDPAMDVRGVVARDRQSALFVFAQTASNASYPAGSIHFAGLDDAAIYELRMPPAPLTAASTGQSPLRWAHEVTRISGLALRVVGVQAPVLQPEQLMLIEVSAAALSSEPV